MSSQRTRTPPTLAPMSNEDRVIARRRQERRDELAAMQNSGVVADRTFDLMRTRFRVSDPRLAPMFSSETASPSHNMRTMSVANDLLGRMFSNVRRAGLENQRIDRHNEVIRAFNMSEPRTYTLPERPYVSRPDRLEGAQSAIMNVDYHPGRAPHYNPRANSISLMNIGHLDQAAHELQHAYDHIRGNLDLNVPEHRVASELLAFTQQHNVSMETTGRPPTMFEGRSPLQMARSYEGKTSKGYPNTLQESVTAVRRWHRDRL